MNWNICSRGKFSNKSENLPFSNFFENTEILINRVCKCTNFRFNGEGYQMNWNICRDQDFPTNRKIFYFTTLQKSERKKKVRKKSGGKNKLE